MNNSIIISQRHKDYIRNNQTPVDDFEIYKHLFDITEVQLLHKYLRWYQAIHNGKLPALTQAQNLFIDVANGISEPITGHEKVYRKYLLANQEYKPCNVISKAFNDDEIEVIIENMKVYFAVANDVIDATTSSLKQFHKSCESMIEDGIECDIARICFLYWQKYHQRQILLESGDYAEKFYYAEAGMMTRKGYKKDAVGNFSSARSHKYKK